MNRRPGWLDRLGSVPSSIARALGSTSCRPAPGAGVVHPEWDTARAVPLRTDPLHSHGDILGLVVARRHPTGWFLSARCRSGLAPADHENLREFITVRVYLLLRGGPTTGSWAQTGPTEWLARFGKEDRVLDVHVPEVVPLGWA